MKANWVIGPGFVALFLLTLTLPLHAAPRTGAATRDRMPFNNHWRFIKGDPEGTGTNLSYTAFRPWLNQSGAQFTTNATGEKPQGNPGSDVSYTQPGFDHSSWRRLNLPHDWGIEGPFRQEYPGETGKLPWWGVGWYRKQFTIPASDNGRQFHLYVDGVAARGHGGRRGGDARREASRGPDRPPRKTEARRYSGRPT